MLFPLDQEKAKMSTTCIEVILEFLSSATRKNKTIEGKQFGKEQIKDYMISYEGGGGPQELFLLHLLTELKGK